MRQADRQAMYCQLGEGIKFPAQLTATEDGKEEDDEEDATTELFFIPQNARK
jgi:hypothetical protein